MNLKQQFKEGLITNNPVLVQRIGMCSTMAITTTLFNGIGMGLSVLIILTCCCRHTYRRSAHLWACSYR